MSWNIDKNAWKEKKQLWKLNEVFASRDFQGAISSEIFPLITSAIINYYQSEVISNDNTKGENLFH